MPNTDLTGSARDDAADERALAPGPNVIPFSRHPGMPRGKAPGSIRLLLVEDDDFDIRLFLMVAAQIGIPAANISIARSIAEARALLATGPFDSHVMDYWLGAETTDTLIAAVLAIPHGSVMVVSNFPGEELRARKVTSDRLQVIAKCELTTTSLSEALGLPSAAGSKADAPGQDMLLGDFALVSLKDELAHLRRLAERISMTVRLADSHLSEGETEEAHIFIVETMNLHRRAEAKIDGLERQIGRKLQPRLP